MSLFSTRTVSTGTEDGCPCCAMPVFGIAVIANAIASATAPACLADSIQQVLTGRPCPRTPRRDGNYCAGAFRTDEGIMPIWLPGESGGLLRAMPAGFAAPNARLRSASEKLAPGKGIEPAYSAWKAAALPLSYTRAAKSNSMGPLTSQE